MNDVDDGLLSTFRRVLRFRRDPLSLFSDVAAREPGRRVVPVALGVRQAVVITSPRPAQHVLMSDDFAKDPRPYGPLGTFRGFMVLGDLIGPALPMLDDDAGKARRRVVQPGFATAHTARCPFSPSTPASSAFLSPSSSSSSAALPAGAFMASLQARVDDVVADNGGGVVDVRRLIAQVVCEQVCHALFGDPYVAWSKPVSAALDVASGALHALSSSFLPAAHVVDVGHASRLRALRRTLVAFATQVVADVHNKRGSAQAPPFAAVNLDALSPAQQVDEVVTQLVAGTESTSLTCSWLLLLLAQHKAALAAVRRDLEQERAPLETLPLTSEHALVRSLRETLRLYPSFWQFLRVARRASTIVDDTDAADVRRVDVAAGTIAFIVPYLAHRDARVFAEPERFDPWRHDASRALGPELLTFGYGPRSCIGARLAVQIATTTTAAFLRGRDFVFVDDHTDTRPLVFGLNRRGGFMATVRPTA